MTSSVTVCSTWILGFISMNTYRPAPSTRNSTVPALAYPMEDAKRTASDSMPARTASSRSRAGAISTTFWKRRWTEQSRSYRWITLPSVSASTCASMWRTPVMASSRKTVESPNALPASRWAASTASVRSAGRSTRRIPRPPPPEEAFTNSGKPIWAAWASASAGRSTGGDWRSTGSPACSAACRARILLPVSLSTAALGPTNVTPAEAQASARSGLSDRKP